MALQHYIIRLKKASPAEYDLTRTQNEAMRLVEAMDTFARGRMPTWPAPGGTSIDVLTNRVKIGRETLLY